MKGIKGVLEFLGWLLLCSFLVAGYNLYNYLTMLVGTGATSQHYPDWFITAAWLECLYFATMFCLTGYALFLYWKEMQRFKVVILAVLVFSILFHLALTVYIDINTDIKEVIDASAKYLYGSIAAGLIWIPYVLFSKRVQTTFINLPSSQYTVTIARESGGDAGRKKKNTEKTKQITASLPKTISGQQQKQKKRISQKSVPESIGFKDLAAAPLIPLYSYIKSLLRTERGIAAVLFLLSMALFLFPPFMVAGNRGRNFDLGHFFVLSPPYPASEIDLKRLALYWLIVFSMCAAWYYFFVKDSRPAHAGDEQG